MTQHIDEETLLKKYILGFPQKKRVISVFSPNNIFLPEIYLRTPPPAKQALVIGPLEKIVFDFYGQARHPCKQTIRG